MKKGISRLHGSGGRSNPVFIETGEDFMSSCYRIATSMTRIWHLDLVT
jgi:hypothetical protein